MEMKLKILLIALICLIAGGTVNAQKPSKKIIISGVVKDMNNIPVPDAIITIDGEKTNSVTNENGYYKVKVTRTARRIGVLSTAGVPEEEIGGRTVINFNLKGSIILYQQMPAKTNVPDDEDVNVGYGRVKKRDLTQPVNKIDGTEKKYASYNNIYDMIRGEIPGVQVYGKNIKIQGAGSIMLSTEPLFVVDGIVVTTIDDISPQIVRSIEVLKGSAASIYGSRGANGVILITTKK